jgi:hypothetical protein
MVAQVISRDLSKTPAPGKPKLLDQVRGVIRLKHYSLRTEKTYRGKGVRKGVWSEKGSELLFVSRSIRAQIPAGVNK